MSISETNRIYVSKNDSICSTNSITGVINDILEDMNVKNVLFLAPGYKYAETVIANQSKELDRKKIPYNASKDPKDMYIRTSKVHVEIIYTDPVKWTSDLFAKRDAVCGKKELVAKALTRFSAYMCMVTMSLSMYIREAHEADIREVTESHTTYIPEITKVHFNDPATIVLWSDGTKTMVKCQEGDVYSEEIGLTLCIAKKALGNQGNFNNIFRKWIPEEEKEADPGTVAIDLDGSKLAYAVSDIKDRISKYFRNNRLRDV